ncbi:hypothetical protein UlMin_010354 [Ulmus minor]
MTTKACSSSQTHEYIKTWRLCWFASLTPLQFGEEYINHAKLFWFKDSTIRHAFVPCSVIPVNTFVLSTQTETMYFIVDTEKEKEDWINSIGQPIVQH